MVMSTDMIPNINYHDFPMYRRLLVNLGDKGFLLNSNCTGNILFKWEMHRFWAKQYVFQEQFHRVFLGEVSHDPKETTLHETNSSHLSSWMVKEDSFPFLEWPIFRGVFAVSFREGTKKHLFVSRFKT